MNGEENIDPAPKSNDTPEDVTENTSQEQAIEQPKTQSENMEVHHHPDLHHRKKNFKEYFLEFIMIFLAVTMGFIAENIRENIVEHEQEKQFIISLINDLKLDTVGLARNIGYKKGRQLEIDSVLYPLVSLKGNDLPLHLCISLAYIPSNPYFFSNDGTLQQLKGSGGMRLIKNRQAVDSIEAYDFQIRRIMLRQDKGSLAVNELGLILNNFLPAKNMFTELYDSLYRVREFDPENGMAINSVYLNQLINQLMLISDNNKFEIELYGDIKQKAENIIRFLKQEYHLENE
jgi:hypothetical protein